MDDIFRQQFLDEDKAIAPIMRVNWEAAYPNLKPWVPKGDIYTQQPNKPKDELIIPPILDEQGYRTHTKG